MCTVSMNLHGVGRSARPTSRWAPKAHRMMGKTQWRHCKRSCGTNVLVFDKQSRHLSLAVPTSKKDVHKTCRYRTSSELENSVLEINHVTNVTTVLDETAASDRVSRYYLHINIRKDTRRAIICSWIIRNIYQRLLMYILIPTCIYTYDLSIYIYTYACVSIWKCIHTYAHVM